MVLDMNILDSTPEEVVKEMYKSKIKAYLFNEFLQTGDVFLLKFSQSDKILNKIVDLRFNNKRRNKIF